MKPSPRPDMILHRTGRPMICPVCTNDVWADAPHVCPEGFVKPAREILTFYGYNALNQCCRSWILLGWPQVDGQPKLADDERGTMGFYCPKCKGRLWFDITHPDMTTIWDEAVQGKPQPPALVGGKIG